MPFVSQDHQQQIQPAEAHAHPAHGRVQPRVLHAVQQAVQEQVQSACTRQYLPQVHAEQPRRHCGAAPSAATPHAADPAAAAHAAAVLSTHKSLITQTRQQVVLGDKLSRLSQK